MSELKGVGETKSGKAEQKAHLDKVKAEQDAVAAVAQQQPGDGAGVGGVPALRRPVRRRRTPQGLRPDRLEPGPPPEDRGGLARARAVLTRLETRRDQTGGIAAGVDSLPLFAAPAAPTGDDLREKLASIDPDNITPREALDLLADLKALAAPKN